MKIDEKAFEAFMTAYWENGPTGLGMRKNLAAYEAAKAPTTQQPDDCREAFEYQCQHPKEDETWLSVKRRLEPFEYVYADNRTEIGWQMWHAAWQKSYHRGFNDGIKGCTAAAEALRQPEREAVVRANRIASGADLICPECGEHAAWVDCFEGIGQVVRPHQVQALNSNENEEDASREAGGDAKAQLVIARLHREMEAAKTVQEVEYQRGALMELDFAVAIVREVFNLTDEQGRRGRDD